MSRHIEAVRAEVFANIIGRTETDPGPYRDPAVGQPETMRKHLTAPADKAHWADMLAELRQSLPGMPGVGFDTILHEQHGNPYRVRDAFNDSVPVARIAVRAATRFKVDDMTPWPVRSVVNARYLELPAFDNLPEPTAVTMPTIIEAMTTRAAAEQKALEPQRMLERQSREYLETRRVKKLLHAVAVNYGVTQPGDELTALARNWTTPNWAHAVMLAADVVIAANDGQWYFADGEAADALQPSSGGSGALPSPVGTGILLTGTSQILAWREVGNRLDVVMRSNIRARLRRPGMTSSGWAALTVDDSAPWGGGLRIGRVGHAF